MMCLYLDNFRGFTDEYIPFEDVNFLVGENSTGKTSVLSLLAILSNPRFWFTQEFNIEDVQLGMFHDIVSIGSNNRRQFRVGLLRLVGPRPMAWLITFGSHEGLPLAKRFDFLSSGAKISVILQGDRLKYHREMLDTRGLTPKRVGEHFLTWVNGQPSRDFREWDTKLYLGRRGWLPLAWSILRRTDSEKKGGHTDEASVALPTPLEDAAWLGPVRSKPKSTYDAFRIDSTSEGQHTPYLVRKLLGDNKLTGKFQKFLGKFGKESELFDTLRIRSYGKEPSSPFALDAVLWGKSVNIRNIGYGVSQSLPVIVEFFARRPGNWFLIQQPEIHLHPKAQAALGETIFRVASKEQQKFLIETHSDYIVDRFRLSMHRIKRKKIRAQVLFFERTSKGNRVARIKIQDNGQYSEDQPASFRRFFVREELKLLEVR